MVRLLSRLGHRAGEAVRELSLFTGAGGGVLGSKLLGWETVGYVEFNEYCQRIIRQRIDDGILDDAPIFGDIRAFNAEGFAVSYQGLVDVVTAGFPCQGWSTAARGRNDADRDLWPETLQTIAIIAPRAVLLENVSSLAVERAAFELHQLGYSNRGVSLSAAELGADHIRERFWLCAYTNDESELLRPIDAKMEVMPELYPSVWTGFPASRRMANGVADRVDRLKAIGNGQVPAVARTAWELLSAE